MKYWVQCIIAILLGSLGIIIIVFSVVENNKAKNQYNKIVDAMNHNTSSSTGCSECNSVAPASWENNQDVGAMFYTKNENPKKSHKYYKGDGKWNINSGPHQAWGPAPVSKYPQNWPEKVAIIESANNLGNALGTLTERKKRCQAGLPIGIALILVALLLVILSLLSDDSSTQN